MLFLPRAAMLYGMHSHTFSIIKVIIIIMILFMIRNDNSTLYILVRLGILISLKGTSTARRQVSPLRLSTLLLAIDRKRIFPEVDGDA